MMLVYDIDEIRNMNPCIKSVDDSPMLAPRGLDTDAEDGLANISMTADPEPEPGPFDSLTTPEPPEAWRAPILGAARAAATAVAPPSTSYREKRVKDIRLVVSGGGRGGRGSGLRQ